MAWDSAEKGHGAGIADCDLENLLLQKRKDRVSSIDFTANRGETAGAITGSIPFLMEVFARLGWGWVATYTAGAVAINYPREEAACRRWAAPLGPVGHEHAMWAIKFELQDVALIGRHRVGVIGQSILADIDLNCLGISVGDQNGQNSSLNDRVHNSGASERETSVNTWLTK